MANLPNVGGDSGIWGAELNNFLLVYHNTDGTPRGGLKFLSNGGVITAATITAAQAAGFQGLFLDPAYVWDMTGLVINGISNFVIESRMSGSIGWGANVSYNTSGYIKTDTGPAPQDGIQIYASAPSTSQTQGIIFRNCVIVGSNSRAVVHLGGGQRSCGFVDTLVYNTNTAAGAYAVILGTGLSANNSESNIFSFTGNGGLAGKYAALGIGVVDTAQHANDTCYYGMRTSGGTYSVVKFAGGNHMFIEHYDRSNPSIATIWNHGGGKMVFLSGEDQNGVGVSHLIDVSSSQTVLFSRSVTQYQTQTTTCQVSAGSLVFRGTCAFNSPQTIAVSGTGTVDMSDTAINGSNVTISGSSGNVLLANSYPGQGNPPVLTSWTGPINYPGGLALQVASPASGTALVNATATLLSWTAPADGQLHRVLIPSRLVVSTLETGGQVTFSVAGNATTIYAGGAAAGTYFNGPYGGVVKSGETVTVQQASALTAGAATVYAEIWAS